MSDSLLERAAVGNAVYATVVVAIDAHYSQHQVDCIEHARARAHTASSRQRIKRPWRGPRNMQHATRGMRRVTFGVRFRESRACGSQRPATAAQRSLGSGIPERAPEPERDGRNGTDNASREAPMHAEPTRSSAGAPVVLFA